MEKDKIVHDFNESPKNGTAIKTKGPIVLFIVLGLLGLATGYVIFKMRGPSVIPVGIKNAIEKAGLKTGSVFGSKDEKTFKDSAEGILREGGIDGEGAFHLERPGGDSQNVYLTSSIIDLSTFVGKKVKVWGETNKAEKAGWLMDVGRLQIL